jgi:hypothetical protein
MNTRHLLVSTFLRTTALAGAALVATVSLTAADDALAADARKTMEKATGFMCTISTEGGYLWRYSPEGRWVSNYRGDQQIRTETFITHMRDLANYVEATK